MKLTAISSRKEERAGGLKIMEEKLSAAGILELFVNASTVEMNLGMENGEVEDEYWGRKYL